MGGGKPVMADAVLTSQTTAVAVQSASESRKSTRSDQI
jgi:hypothetical protein